MTEDPKKPGREDIDPHDPRRMTEKEFFEKYGPIVSRLARWNPRRRRRRAGQTRPRSPTPELVYDPVPQRRRWRPQPIPSSFPDDDDPFAPPGADPWGDASPPAQGSPVPPSPSPPSPFQLPPSPSSTVVSVPVFGTELLRPPAPPGAPVNVEDEFESVSKTKGMKLLLRMFSDPLVGIIHDNRFDIGRFNEIWNDPASNNSRTWSALPMKDMIAQKMPYVNFFMYKVKNGTFGESKIERNNENGDSVMFINLDDQQYLMSYIAMYIGKVLTQLVRSRKYAMMYSDWSITEGDEDDEDSYIPPPGTAEYALCNIDVASDWTVHLQDFIFMLSRFRILAHNELLDGDHGDTFTWEERDSGISIQYGGVRIVLYLRYRELQSHAVSAMWSESMKPILMKKFGGTGVTVCRNQSDYLCLFYTILMGMIKMKWNSYWRSNAFPTPGQVLRYARNLGQGWDDAYRIINEFINNEDNIIHRMLTESRGVIRKTTKEIMKFYEMVEFNLIKDESIAMDVYGCRLVEGQECHIFPCYVSRKDKVPEERRIKILSLDFGEISHYALVNNWERVIECTGRKQFYTCSGCHQSFFTRADLCRHKDENGDCPGATELDFSWSTVLDRSFNEPGIMYEKVCNRCHLMFASPEAYEHHEKYCFMKNRSGNVFVRLPPDNALTLTGEETPRGEDGEFLLADKYILFADFESSIDPETGLHSFMSYGLYDTKYGDFHLGYTLDEFFAACVQKVENASPPPGKMCHIWVYFHNAMNYDANFLLRYVLNSEEYSKWSIKLLMKSSSRLQTLEFYWQKGQKRCKITVGDTFRFLSTSLDTIVSSIRTTDAAYNEELFPHFHKFMKVFFRFHNGKESTPEERDLVLHKNLFPYKFFTGPPKLYTPMWAFKKIFEPREENLDYFSEGVTVEQLEENYPKFLQIVSMMNFEHKYAKDYHDLYLGCDVLEICDVFLSARRTLAESHHIDLCDYIGMPSATWHAFLRFDQELSLPLYEDTFYAEFFQNMIRGGVTSAPLRYAKCDDSHSILYFDVNGLYPYVMQKYRYPCGTFRTFKLTLDSAPDWNTRLLFYFASLKAQNKGCCLRVDLEIPEGLHDYFDQFPPAPEHRVLKDCYLDADGKFYSFLQKWSRANEGELMKPFKGLVGTLYDKVEYPVHWRLLMWYMKHGLIVKAVHYVIEFDEGDYLAGYVRMNIEKRNHRTDALGKMVYKLMSNALYGKTFESPFNHGNFVIVRNSVKLNGILEQGNVNMIVPIDENNSIVKLDGEVVTLNKPTYIGACVTEYAKLVMYKLFYDKLDKLFPGVELVYTDTDSFIIRIHHEPGMTYRQIEGKINEKYPDLIGPRGGSIKSETGEDLIDEVVALRSKLYAYKTLKGKIGKRAKGTTAAAQQDLTWETYLESLISLKSVKTHNMQFVRQGFTITSKDLVKQSISVNDGKRYILEDGIHTHAWGHYSIQH